MPTEFALKLALWQPRPKGSSTSSQTSIPPDVAPEFRRVLFSNLGGSIRKVGQTDYLVEASDECYSLLVTRARNYFAPADTNVRIQFYENSDSDGDEVLLGSNEELIDAIQCRLEHPGIFTYLPLWVQIVKAGASTAAIVESTTQHHQADTDVVLLQSMASRQEEINKKLDWKSAVIYVLSLTILILGALLQQPVESASPQVPNHTNDNFQDAKAMISASPDVHKSQSPKSLFTSNLSSSTSASSFGTVSSGSDCPLSNSSLATGPDTRKSSIKRSSSNRDETKDLDMVKSIFSKVVDEEPQPGTPLWKALTWVGGDSGWKRHSKERLFQRIGLALFYYSTNGDVSWKRSDNWLDYDVHECQWWPGGFTMPVCGEDKYDRELQDWQYERLWLPSNGLEGTLPTELFKLIPSLRHVRLDRNIWLGGAIPSSIGRLTELRSVILRHNMFHGTLPTELGRLSNLEILWLSENEFEGSLPPSIFGSFTSLRMLFLDHNRFRGNVPTEIAFAPLVLLSLSHNHFSVGGLPASMLGSLHRLKHLVAPISMYTSSDEGNLVIPTEVGLLSHLRTLDLYIPPGKWLTLSSHRWQRSEVATISNLEKIRVGTEGSDDELVDLATL